MHADDILVLQNKEYIQPLLRFTKDLHHKQSGMCIVIPYVFVLSKLIFQIAWKNNTENARMSYKSRALPKIPEVTYMIVPIETHEYRSLSGI